MKYNNRSDMDEVKKDILLETAYYTKMITMSVLAWVFLMFGFCYEPALYFCLGFWVGGMGATVYFLYRATKVRKRIAERIGKP